MKSRKGFTLVELIGVVILIGLIALIAIPSVDYIITKTKNNAYNRTKDTLKDGLRNWVTDNKELIYEDGEEIIVTLADLKEQGYIEYEIKNPKTSTCLANTMQFKITRVKDNEKDTYEYTFLDEELIDGNLKDCEAVSKTPSIYLLGDNPQKIEITNDSTLTYASFDPGATAKSSAGEDMSSSIVKSNNVNLKVLGKDYHAKYTIIENGISKTLTRKVYVVDTTAPELNVPEDLEIGIGETLNLMEGVTATDNSGVAPTIKTSGTINYNRPGEYIITYIATDKSGNSVSKNRKITLVSKYSYLETYSAGLLSGGFRSSSYAPNITSISFIDNVDIPANAVATWDLSEAKDNSIKGWIIESASNAGYYNMYIGSNGTIKANIDSSYWFYRLDNLYTVNFENYDTSDVVNMSYMFAGYDEEDVDPISANILDDFKINYLNNFNDKNNIEQLVVIGDDASVFNCSNITNLDLTNWDTSSVQNMSHMFEGMCSLGTLDLSSFDTSNVVDMSYMFAGHDSSYAYDDYLKSDTKKLTPSILDGLNKNNSIENLVFRPSQTYYCSDIAEIDFSGWDTANVEDMSHMFEGLCYIESLDLSSFDTEKVKDMSSMFHYNYNLSSINLNGWDTSNVTDMSYMFSMRRADRYYMDDGNNVLLNLNLSHFNTHRVTNMSGMFEYLEAVESLDLSTWNTSNVTNMSYMFYNMKAPTINVSGWDTSQVTNMSYMFSDTAATTLDLSHFNTSNVTNMSCMFYNSKATAINTSGWNTGKVTSMSSMFYGTNVATLDLSHFNTANVTSMNSMFYSSKATTINVSGWNTSKVTNMSYMFRATAATTLNLSSLDVSNVTNMSYMFYGSKATAINTSGWNTGKVTNMSYMFYGTNVATLDLSHFNTANVTSMSAMFETAKATTINVSGWNTGKVTSMSSMFDTTNVASLDLRHFNTANVTSMSYMFYNSKISNINVSGWNVEKVTTLSSMFYGITSLTSLDLSSWSLSSNLDYMSSMFNGTTNLKTIKTPKNIPSTVSMSNITSYAFTGSDGNTYAAGTFPTGNAASITLTR
ncbi:MAG: BspA family leucine-rich repeat surface protein [Bacilli bacterium]|nr:BspA family leucine-rich repeat surface protein [Bacilli bacterium]